MSVRAGRVRAWCVIAAVPILLSVAAGDAVASTQVRFLHALPGGPTATLRVSGGSGSAAALGGVGFGEASDYASAPSGHVTLTLTAAGKRVAGAGEDLRDGLRYTVVAERAGAKGVGFHVYRNGSAKAGKAQLRAVHVAPELDRAEFRLGDRSLGQLVDGGAGSYVAADPGTYALTARTPGSASAMVSKPGVSLAAGTSSTAYLVGSGGEQTRFVVLEDSAAAPSKAPATGLGGQAGGGSPWLLALLAAIVAGAIGGAAYTRASSRRGRARA